VETMNASVFHNHNLLDKNNLPAKK